MGKETINKTKTAYWMGENICKEYDQKAVVIQNMYKQLRQLVIEKKTAQLKNEWKTWKDIFPKKIYRWSTGTWRDA